WRPVLPSVAGPLAPGATYHHDADHSPGEHRVPYAFPGLDQGAGFGGMRVPAVPFAGEGLGRPEEGAFLGRTAPLRAVRLGGRRIEFPRDEHPRDHVD